MAYNALIVDDSRVTRALVAKTLRLSGIEFGEMYEAADGQEALDRLASNWVDIVFADIHMPRMSGAEMVDRMAEQGLLDATPVVVISTERSVTRIQELKAKGISAYLKKPFTPEAIKETVQKLLGPSVGENTEE